MRTVRLVNSPSGRTARALVGLALIVAGAAGGGGAGGLALALTGLIPLAAGALGVCLAAPLFGVPLRAR